MKKGQAHFHFLPDPSRRVLDSSAGPSVYRCLMSIHLSSLTSKSLSFRVLRVFVCSWLVLATSTSVSSQEPVIRRSEPMTLTGEIVEISCYKQKGVAGSTGAAHVDCAKMCVRTKGTALGILSDGDGLFRLWGNIARDKYEKLMPYVGQEVTITGTEVVLSNNYDVRSFDVQTIKAAKK
jgi:hypothetical protein